MTGLSRTPEPPYWAVIFTSLRTGGDHGYAEAAQRMLDLAAGQPGFLGVDSGRDPGGTGITVSYWRDEAAIAAWKAHAEHTAVRERGRSAWYTAFTVRIAEVARQYDFGG
jgi:heme-degrading monooxygenase HmoA